MGAKRECYSIVVDFDGFQSQNLEKIAQALWASRNGHNNWKSSTQMRLVLPHYQSQRQEELLLTFELKRSS